MADQPDQQAGNPQAQTSLGVLYAEGQGVAADDAKAAEWLQRAAEQGHAPAQANLASLYAQGKGVAESKSRAYMWLALAARSDASLNSRRDAAARALTPAELAVANSEVRRWKPKGAGQP